MIKGFLFALQFLTILPFKAGAGDDAKIKTAIIYFPLAGLLLGLILAGANVVLSYLSISRLFANTILLMLLAFLTGGLHLDGLADTLDAVLSGKSKEEMLKIMRDPHIGSMGTLGLIFIVISGIALLSEIPAGSKTASLLLMCVISRWSMVMAMSLFPYAREEGKGRAFFRNIDLKNFAISSAAALIVIMSIARLNGLLIFAAAGICAYAAGILISRKIGGLTGDNLGAINEITQIAVLTGVWALSAWVY